MPRAPIQKRFGSAVRAARLELNWSQELLAEKAGLDRTYISGIERGARNPALINLDKIAKALHKNLAQLLE